MHIADIIRGDSPTFSFEFFPLKTPAAAESLYQTIRDLESYGPHLVSVTFGVARTLMSASADRIAVTAVRLL